MRHKKRSAKQLVLNVNNTISAKQRYKEAKLKRKLDKLRKLEEA